MSHLFLLDVTHLHSRAGIARHSHFRLFSVLRKLFTSRRPACNCR